MLRLLKIENIFYNNSVILQRQYLYSRTPLVNSKYSLSTKCKADRIRKPRRNKKSSLVRVTSQSKKHKDNIENEVLFDFTNNGNVSSNSLKSLNSPSSFKLQYSKENDVYNEKPFIFFSSNRVDLLNDLNKLSEVVKNTPNLNETKKYDEKGNFFSERHDILEELDKISRDTDQLIDKEIKDSHLNLHSVSSEYNIDDKNKESKLKSKHHKSVEDERIAKDNSLLVNLLSYVNICVVTGIPNRGLSTLLMCRKKFQDQSFLGVDIYNIILHAFAKKGNFIKIKEILNVLHDDKITLNYQSFAAIFECLGRLEINDNNLKELRKFQKEAEKLNITLNDILDKSVFKVDQREIVLNAIRQIEPDFQPIYTPPSILYSNPLLSDLNNGVEGFETNELEENSSKNRKIEFSADQLKIMSNKQLKIELEGSITVKSIEGDVLGNRSRYYKDKLNALYAQWKNQIVSAINRDLNISKSRMLCRPHIQMTYYTYLKALDAEKYADILLNEVKILASSSETYSPTVTQLYRGLGNKVKTRFIIEQKQKNKILDKISDVYDEYCKQLEDSNVNDNSRQIWQRIAFLKKSTGSSIDYDEISWPNNVSFYIGKFLYNILIRDVKIDVNIMRDKQNKTSHMLPAFYTLFRNHGKTVKEEVKAHPVLIRLLQASNERTLTFDSNTVPMLCPPQPWSTPIHGGYLLSKSELIRLPQQAMQQWKRINELKLEDMYPALDSLNQLASVPWRINNQVLDVIVKVFNDGGDDKLSIPRHPNTLSFTSVTSVNKENFPKSQQIHQFYQKMIYKQKQAEMYSLWCDALYRLSLANHYRGKTFWLPHNMDFRGRVYPIPPHLNHLGSDMARSILVFDKARPLGNDGFTWLKLHCVNLTGLKKRSPLNDRILFAESIMDDIIDSADNPLTGKKWWTKSDEPWQTLACCMEIAKVKRSKNPKEYLSHFPVHQDGSCNGLQHYAALGRDKIGAHSVNLIPSNIPQDVYSTVANLVEKCREKEEHNGSEVAKILKGFISRKVIKQTVMTTVYGVTRYGARLQIAKQLKDIDTFPKDWVWPASTYLTTKTFECLREMFMSAKQIQDWFTECARIISQNYNANVEWITPLGLPVVQPYNNRTDSMKIRNSAKISETIYFDMYEKPNTTKQKNAFPPNFIHSLDSSHMMLTSLYCQRNNVTFMSVHDCFWTHACTVAEMNKICREQFVALHSQPILEDLSESLIKRYSFIEIPRTKNNTRFGRSESQINNTFKNVPEKGNFDLNDVLRSIYFFS